jgi:HPt (histidine-containing phosphotransfer) domain-containing protein
MQPTDPTVVLDREQLKNITMDDEFLMREIVGALVADTARQLDNLKEALGRGAAAECARLAHSARGACGNVGATSLWAVFSEIEAAAKESRLDQCRLLLERAAVEFDKLRQEAAAL